LFFFSSRRRHTRYWRDWSSDVCSSDLLRGWRAALPLVAVACFSPGRAAAECGDYVTILNGPAVSGHHAMPEGGPAPAKPPCHGPNCSGSPVREPAPLAPVVPAGSQAKELTEHTGHVGGADV